MLCRCDISANKSPYVYHKDKCVGFFMSLRFTYSLPVLDGKSPIEITKNVNMCIYLEKKSLNRQLCVEVPANLYYNEDAAWKGGVDLC